MNTYNNNESKKMHPATCGDCGSATEVPFKPSGEKPVLCTDCFKKKKSSEGGGYQSNRRDTRTPRKKEFNTRTLSRPGTTPSPFADLSKLQGQVDALHKKMDTVLKLLGHDPTPVSTIVESQPKDAPAQEQKDTKSLKDTIASIEGISSK